MQSLTHFLHANWPFCMLVVHMVLSAMVGVTPKAYQNKPFWGMLLKVANLQSSLAHYDEKGTVQIPLVRKVLGVGHKLLDAAEQSLPKAPDGKSGE